ncbi:hypothetical protein AKO1_006825, partial [Acrasis kona]
MGILTFTFDMPQTKPVSFDKLSLKESGDSGESKKKLQQATKLREKVYNALSKHRSYSDTVQLLEDYLPYLNGIVHALERPQNESDVTTIAFQWTSGLLEDSASKTILAKSKKAVFTRKNIKFELFMILWTYGYSLCNLAADLVRTATQSTFYMQTKEASILFRKASGIFQYLETELSKASLYLDEKKLPEVLPQSASTLQNYCLALSQIIAIHHAIESGKSLRTIAKLCVQVYRQFDSAKNFIDETVNHIRNETPTSAKYNPSGLSSSSSNYSLNSSTTPISSSSSQTNINEGVRIIIVQYRILYRGITLYYLALDANKDEQAGLSVGYITTANLQLKELDIFKDVKNNPFIPEVRRIYTESKKLEGKYEKENRMVFREDVPLAENLEIPKGLSLFKASEFVNDTA